MESDILLFAFQQGAMVTGKILTPLLTAMIGVGVAISIVQVVTQVNDATLTFVPKMLVLYGLLFAMGHRLLGELAMLVRSLWDFSGI